MRLPRSVFAWCAAGMAAILPWTMPNRAAAQPAGAPSAIAQLFDDWRRFEVPPLVDDAPDYRVGTFEMRRPSYERLRARLGELDKTASSTSDRVDLALIRAEMNGYDFNLRVLQPWARDPAFYATVRT